MEAANLIDPDLRLPVYPRTSSECVRASWDGAFGMSDKRAGLSLEEVPIGDSAAICL